MLVSKKPVKIFYKPVKSKSKMLNKIINFIDNLKLKLIKAKHIPGSAQVEIEYEGTRLTYTSDFKKPGSETPIIESDVLIMDAIYGRPEYVRDFDDLIEEILADFIKELLTKGPVYVYGYVGAVCVYLVPADYDWDAVVSAV